jgi:hypothetical protein
MHRIARLALALAGVALVALSVAFLIDEPSVTSLWPWPISRLSRIFLASMLMAAAAPVIGIAISGELAAVAPGALNLFVAGLGIAAFCFTQADGTVEQRPVLFFAMGAAAFVVLMAALFLWSSGVPFRDQRRLPWSVYLAFAAFALILVVAGIALIRGRPNTFPWPLSPELSVLYGCMFIGAACYFVHGLVKPVWGNAKGQLYGFLAYDLVLLGPFVQHFSAVPEPMLVSLIVYTAILAFSALLAIYYIFVSRDAWPWGWDVLQLGKAMEARRPAR